MNVTSIPFRERGKDRMYNIWHRIEEGAELIYVLQGSGSIVFKSGVYPLRSGALYYIAKGALHYTLPDEPERYDRIKLLISPTVIRADREIADFLCGKDAVIAALPQNAAKKAEELLAALSAENDSRMKNAEALANALNLLVLLCRYSSEMLEAPSDIVSGAVAYINDRISEPITVDILCSAVHTSKYYLCHKFKKQTGVTVMQYITKTRIELAKEMLTSQRELSVSEVSERCGFSNVSYFCAVFKKEVGVSPLTYTKNNQYHAVYNKKAPCGAFLLYIFNYMSVPYIRIDEIFF